MDSVTAGTMFFNGAPMTLVGRGQSGAGGVTTEMWMMASPPAGTYNVTGGAGWNHLSIIGAAVLNGVNTVNPIRDARIASGDPQASSSSVNVASVAGDLVLDCMGAGRNADPADLVAGAGQTEFYDLAVLSVPSKLRAVMSMKAAAATSTSMSWTWTRATSYGHVAASFVPVTASPPPSPEPITLDGVPGATAASALGIVHTHKVTVANKPNRILVVCTTMDSVT
jgi:hypothetical protein